MDNKYSGIKDIKLGGKSAKLFYGWEAISSIKSQLGERGLLGLMHKDLKEVALVLKAGLEEHQPNEYSIEEIIKISPAIIPTVTLINEALEYSYWGPDGAPKEDAPDSGDIDAKKKTSSQRPLKRRSLLEYLFKPSGD